ncbi:unnamed protein product [Owenia fusiformis]|uniref:CXXC motif containing zinc binding protein n=1 Tax=Owenia fusiformis TaxID=6347 RepID=A0A8S4N285_OWEFU|nr:unnamed protein product [Owenia fusiformis]
MKIALQFKARLEFLTNLRPEGEDFRWYLKLKCLNCGEETPEFTYLSLLENSPLKGGRGHASLVLKCKLCARENSIDIVKESIGTYTAEDSDSSKLVKIVTFDCRGVEPTDFSPRAGWTAEGAESGSKFSDINLLEKEWCDYDEKVNESVGIYDCKHAFVTVK